MVDLWSDPTTQNLTPAGVNYFSQFDQRTNNPTWNASNVDSSPDGIIDFIVYIYRYDKGWEQQPRNGMAGWVGSGGGYINSSVTSPSTPIQGFGFHHGFVAPKEMRILLYLPMNLHMVSMMPHTSVALIM